MRPRPRRCIDAQENVGGKERTKEHHFRREEKPDANLGVPKSSVGTSWKLYTEFPLRWNLSQNRFSGRFSASALRRFHRFVLHREIAFATGETVFVGAAIGHGSMNKISVWRR